MPYCRIRLIFQCLTLVVAVTGDPPLAGFRTQIKRKPLSAAAMSVRPPVREDGVGFGRTNLSIPLQLGPEVASAYESALKELNSFWQYNESAYHLTKYDEFDHSHFDDSFEHSGGVDSAESGIKEPPSSGVSAGVAGAPPAGPRAPTQSDPVFDNNLVTNVTAQLGGNAFLHCRVKNLGERPVSWVRRRDWHILTSNMFTYTNDERFQVVHSEGSDDWDLQIKYVQKRDNGTYECQVATGHGTISHYFNLHVVVPSAFILGSGEYHIGEGSTISLVCIIENSPSPPQYVFWYHNERMINYDTSRGGVTVSTEPGPKTHSRLIINSATHADSGNYTCRASNTEADTIHVFVSKDDNTAAIQRQESSAAVAASFASFSQSPTIILITGCFGVKILLHSHVVVDHLLLR